MNESGVILVYDQAILGFRKIKPDDTFPLVSVTLHNSGATPVYLHELPHTQWLPQQALSLAMAATRIENNQISTLSANSFVQKLVVIKPVPNENGLNFSDAQEAVAAAQLNDLTKLYADDFAFREIAGTSIAASQSKLDDIIKNIRQVFCLSAEPSIVRSNISAQTVGMEQETTDNAVEVFTQALLRTIDHVLDALSRRS
jgi:hypothetical protein